MRCGRSQSWQVPPCWRAAYPPSRGRDLRQVILAGAKRPAPCQSYTSVGSLREAPPALRSKAIFGHTPPHLFRPHHFAALGLISFAALGSAIDLTPLLASSYTTPLTASSCSLLSVVSRYAAIGPTVAAVAVRAEIVFTTNYFPNPQPQRENPLGSSGGGIGT
ncbi:hypothetical protein PCANC_08113 [Puccinia coronata f. sp. avenae]|uniref:Uncharacterized protein n=1 Tax=Puccinia coronata f. sp. avenae TaxID=200324 RepID=A0A2N5V3H5_9BASI|nr:hypothetical protein PCANC_08113 [Puccinia coronata f. sp. avenae]